MKIKSQILRVYITSRLHNPFELPVVSGRTCRQGLQAEKKQTVVLSCNHEHSWGPMTLRTRFLCFSPPVAIRPHHPPHQPPFTLPPPLPVQPLPQHSQAFLLLFAPAWVSVFHELSFVTGSAVEEPGQGHLSGCWRRPHLRSYKACPPPNTELETNPHIHFTWACTVD